MSEGTGTLRSVIAGKDPDGSAKDAAAVQSHGTTAIATRDDAVIALLGDILVELQTLNERFLLAFNKEITR